MCLSSEFGLMHVLSGWGVKPNTQGYARAKLYCDFDRR